jgi:serine/threonine protein kinase
MVRASPLLLQGLCNLVARCLNKDADTRPSATELLKDPLFKHAHDGKWLAKRLLGATDKSSSGNRRVTFEDGQKRSPPGSVTPRQHTAAPVSPLVIFFRVIGHGRRCVDVQAIRNTYIMKSR